MSCGFISSQALRSDLIDFSLSPKRALTGAHCMWHLGPSCICIITTIIIVAAAAVVTAINTSSWLAPLSFSSSSSSSLGCDRSGHTGCRQNRELIASVDANASSVLFITCSQTPSPLRVGRPVLVEQPVLLLNAFAYSFPLFALWQLAHLLPFFSFLSLSLQVLHCSCHSFALASVPTAFRPHLSLFPSCL